MKHYNSIPYWTSVELNQYCYAFEKYDGSCIRAEWERKQSKHSSNMGFRKFGTRQQMIDNPRHPFYEAAQIFVEKYAEPLDRLFYDSKEFRGIDTVTVYGEYFGPNSFAGWHEKEDEKDLILFDIEKKVKGFLPPRIFVDMFGEFGIPRIIYQGNLTEEFINDIFEGKYDVDEGVVCKGTEHKKGKEVVWMCKCKTKEWLNKVKEKMGQKALLEEFNGDVSMLF